MVQRSKMQQSSCAGTSSHKGSFLPSPFLKNGSSHRGLQTIFPAEEHSQASLQPLYSFSPGPYVFPSVSTHPGLAVVALICCVVANVDVSCVCITNIGTSSRDRSSNARGLLALDKLLELLLLSAWVRFRALPRADALLLSSADTVVIVDAAVVVVVMLVVVFSQGSATESELVLI